MNIYLVLLIALPTAAMMALSAEMARSRGRSVNAWRWFAFLTGPLPVGPIALYVLGNRKEPA
jgi:ABC-type Fe3+-siderophore transport system permease subunit